MTDGLTAHFERRACFVASCKVRPHRDKVLVLVDEVRADGANGSLSFKALCSARLLSFDAQLEISMAWIRVVCGPCPKEDTKLAEWMPTAQF